MLDDIFFAAEIDLHIEVIDLHEFHTIPEALEQLEQKLFSLFQKGEKYIRVVHGIGGGHLAGSVHEALNKNPLVRSWKEGEQGGNCIVVF
jgi:dsDNA-specific endonuclease/ATPase MutS2